jgi:hypothetical protein
VCIARRAGICRPKSARFPGFYRRTSRFLARTYVVRICKRDKRNTTTKTMARGGLTLLALALATQLSVEAFSQNDNAAWNARFAELHSDLYTAPLPAALVSQCKNKGKVSLNQVTANVGAGHFTRAFFLEPDRTVRAATSTARPTTASSRRRRAAVFSRCRRTSGRTAARAPAVERVLV